LLYIIIFICFVFLLYVVRENVINRQNKKLLLSVTSLDRGTSTEKDLILKLLKNGIPSKAVFHDLMIRKGENDFSQIDLVLATKQGIVVFEVKDYKGWIFGTGNHNNWTQVLAYGKRKYRFYNPVKQNKNHINNLKNTLKQFEKIPFYSIVVFYGDCTLKEIEYIPKDTYIVKPHRIMDVLNQIKNNNESATYSNKQEIVDELNKAVILGGDEEALKKHINRIKDKVGKHRVFD
jgi:hypothetical protein